MAFVGNYSAKAALYSPRWKGVRHDVRARYHGSAIADLLIVSASIPCGKD